VLRRPLVILICAVACRSGGAPSPSSDPAPPPPPAEAESICAPTGNACFTRAEQRSESDPAGAEEDLRRCLTCIDAPPSSYQLLASLLADRGAKEEQRQTLQLGVRRFPTSVLLLRSLGRLSLALGRHREGISHLGQAHRLRPNDEEIAAEYRDALKSHGTKEDRLEAELQPLLLEATGRFEIDDAKGAIGVLETALVKSAPVPRLRALVHHRIAIVHLGSGHLTEAKKHLVEAMSAEKNGSELRADVLVSYAEVLLSEGKLEEAEKAAGEAIQIEPKNPLAHANLAIARALAGNEEGAMSAFEAAFDTGLARRLTLSDFLAIGRPIEALKDHPGFTAMVKRAYPSAQYPPK
jgi:tetratricopeptide (TPR) repeat protein